MIDDIGKTMALMEKMRAALPLNALATKEVRKILQENSDKVFPRECGITEIRYMNDEGGIACHLDFGFSEEKNVVVISITHLRFYRRHPLTREIEAYCKHRVKRLKKQNRRMAPI
jgi:DNA transposition AAA+ family ATPase